MAELRQNEEWKKNMTFLKEQFFPALLATGESIEATQMFIGGFHDQIMQSVLGRMKELTMKDLGISSKVAAEDPLYDQHRAIVELFDDMDALTAQKLIEGMKGEIELWKSNEMKERKLDSLTVVWLDD